jgi:zinc/manganese transport system permease protein
VFIADANLTWNLVDDAHQLFQFQFMVNAYRAGTVVAIAAAVIGWFTVLRRQSFVGHTLSVVAFPGAAGATLIGIGVAWGYFGFCITAALVIAAIPRRHGHSFSEESAIVGTVQAFALACGFLFVTLYRGLLTDVNSLLFGSFLGVTENQVLTLAAVSAGALAVLALIARPLLFSSIDPDVAASRGIPGRLLSVVFLVVLGVAVAEASQITGVLLVFALLIVPAATAHTITSRPVLGLACSLAVGLVVTWLGLALAFFSDQPVGFWITNLAFGAYLVANAVDWLRRRRPRLWLTP